MTIDSIDFEIICDDMQHIEIELDPQAAAVGEASHHSSMFNDKNR